MNAVEKLLKDFGFDYFCLSFLPTLDQTFDDVLLQNVLPEGWLPFYDEKRFYRIDPSLQHCRNTVYPYRWFKESPYRPEKEKQVTELVHRAQDFGLRDGIVVPVASPTRQIGQVWMGGAFFQLERHALPVLHLMAL